MTLRHISPRSVEWYEATEEEDDEVLTPQEVLALRTMKALEDASIRAEISRVHHQSPAAEIRLAFRLPPLQARPA
jgi:hypothetical protein